MKYKSQFLAFVNKHRSVMGKFLFSLCVFYVLQIALSAVQPEDARLKIDLLEQEVRILRKENDSLKQELNQYRLEKKIHQLELDVSKLRGLEIKKPLVTKSMSKSELLQYIESELKRQYPGENLAMYQECLIRLGFIPEKTDIKETLKGLFSEQVAGLYDDTSKRLFIMNNFNMNETVSDVILAHEICHALQDQNFNIGAMDMRRPDNDDAVYARLSTLEGDATILMTEWLQQNITLSSAFQIMNMLGLDQSAFNNAPYFLQQILIFPYLQGSAFVMRAISERGMEGRNEIFRNPPLSTEQIMHPEKYLSEWDAPTSNVILPESFFMDDDTGLMENVKWHRKYYNVFGEMGFKLLFDQYMTGQDAAQAAAGWDGDRYGLFESKDGVFLIFWESVWDSPKDADEAANGLQRVIAARYPKWKMAKSPYPGCSMWNPPSSIWGDKSRILLSHKDIGVVLTLTYRKENSPPR